MSEIAKMWVGDDGFLYYAEDAVEAGENKQAVTVLCHGDDGSVGEFEPWMVEWLRGGGIRCVPRHLLRGSNLSETIAAAISKVLGQEVEHE